MPKVDCPKCSSESAWYQVTEVDVILRCLCGYHKVVQTRLETMVIEHRETDTQVRLPRVQSNLWLTVIALYALESASSAEITERLADFGKDFTVSDVASYLTILRSKGLVETTEVRRGIIGGSTWRLTDAADDLM